MGDRAELTYVGHATVLIEQAGKRVLTDPALGRMLEG
jgi:L-ascorbate metabolism protein UlaG (beta-lactamase superfamily)